MQQTQATRVSTAAANITRASIQLTSPLSQNPDLPHQQFRTSIDKLKGNTSIFDLKSPQRGEIVTNPATNHRRLILTRIGELNRYSQQYSPHKQSQIGQELQTPINQGLNDMVFYSHRSSRDLKYECDAKHEITRRSVDKHLVKPEAMTQKDTMGDLQELLTEYTGKGLHNSFVGSPIN